MRSVAWQLMNSHIGYPRARWSKVETRRADRDGSRARWPSGNESEARHPTGPAGRADQLNHRARQPKWESGAPAEFRMHILLVEHARASRSIRFIIASLIPATPQNYVSQELFNRENGAVLSLLKLAAAVTHLLRGVYTMIHVRRTCAPHMYAVHVR